MAKAVILAIKENTMLADAPEVTLAASSAGMLTAQQDGYTMSAAPEEIVGWRGRTLEKDGDTTVIYTNIKDEVPTSFDDLYSKTSALPMAAQAYPVTVVDGDGAIPSPSSGRMPRETMTDTTETGIGDDPVTTSFAGSVRGVDGYVLVHG